MDGTRRRYRESMQPEGFVSFTGKYKESDLHFAVEAGDFMPDLAEFAESRIIFYRTQLEEYLQLDPFFRLTLEPHLVRADAPPIALVMARAANTAGVGPMAAVAGAFAELVGKDLLCRVKQVIVENGGDIFLQVAKPVQVSVLAGDSPLQVALELPVRTAPYGVCTSSGTVGPSLSLGKADAAVIISSSAPLADAVATAAGNRVQTASDLPAALAFARNIRGVEGVLLIKDDKMAAWGNIKLVPA
ncbi:MAG: UPF0280 family protein [Firmicutes bacterium]|nr:UPF0280 family protein [Bacillota bacterium]